MANNYLYHPLGDFAQYYADGTYGPGDNEFPRTHSEHNNGGIDFNPGSKLPVHAMADGEVVFIGVYNSSSHYKEKSAGYYVEIKSNSFGYNGTVYMRYLEMGWLESPLAEAIGVEPGTSGTSIKNAPSVRMNTSIQIKAGDIIGYTNEIGNGQTNLHIDLQQHATLSGGGLISSSFDFNKNNSSIGEYGEGYKDDGKNWYQDGKIVGQVINGIGYVPYGEASSKFQVFNHYWYCTILSKPILRTGVPAGGVKLNPTVPISEEYQNWNFTERYMGKFPNNISDINNETYRPLRTLALAARGEFGGADEGLSYGKLFRVWILYETERFPSLRELEPISGPMRGASSTLKDFAAYWSKIVFYKWNENGWQSTQYWNQSAPETEEFLSFMQNIYMNIAYPDIYGISKEACIEACSNMPYSNETTDVGSDIPVTYGSPLIFLVKEKFSGGWYILFRTENHTNNLLSANEGPRSQT